MNMLHVDINIKLWKAIWYLKSQVDIIMLYFDMVAYFCHHVSDNYGDLSDLFVVLLNLYVDRQVDIIVWRRFFIYYVDLSDHYVDLSENDVDLSDHCVDLSENDVDLSDIKWQVDRS